MAKKKYAKADEIPEGMKNEYFEKEGEWHLKLDDDDAAETKRKLDEFRETNRTLKKEHGDLLAAHGQLRSVLGDDFDAKSYQSYQEKVRALKAEEERELMKTGNWEELVKRRTAASISQKDEELKIKDKAYRTLEQERDNLRGSLGKHLIERSAQVEIGNQGLKIVPGGLEDVLHRANRDWKIDDKGESVPQNREGKLMYDEHGNPIKWDGYVKRLLTEAPHLFERASGGDSEGNTVPRVQNGKLKIKSNDRKAIGANMAKLASGEAELID